MPKSEFLKLGIHNYPDMHGYIKYLHFDREEEGRAYEKTEEVVLQIRIPRYIGTAKLNLRLVDERLNTEKMVDCKWTSLNFGYDEYEVTVNEDVGLYFFSIEMFGISHLYGYKDKGNRISFSENSNGNLFQISISDFKYDAPWDIYGGIIYHIFVDRFSRSGKSKIRDDGVFIEDWYSLVPEYPEYPGAYMKNNAFFGGDLIGIEERVDYLLSLGVSAIYLSPIFESKSNHKYDTADYMKIDEGFGGDKAFISLLKKCREANIKIIIDAVFNHTGSDSVYFNKNNSYDSIGAYQSKESKFYGWYSFKSYPNEYESWWGIDILPRINTLKSECSNYFVGENGVVDKYCDMGVYGLRLDVADELSDEFIRAIKNVQNKHNKASLLYGEVWEDASNKVAYNQRKRYYLGDELDGVMNYPLREGIIDFLRFGRTEKLEYAIIEVMMNMPKRIRDACMNLLGSHDTPRIITALAGELQDGKTNKYLHSACMNEEEYEKGRSLLCMAYAILATLPGVPSLFYADEAGMQGYSDPFNRRCYPWGREDKKIIEFYRKIGKIRRENNVYKQGSFLLKVLRSDLLIFERYDANNRYVTFVNNSEFEKGVAFFEFTTELITNISGKEFSVAPLTVAIFCLEKREENEK